MTDDRTSNQAAEAALAPPAGEVIEERVRFGPGRRLAGIMAYPPDGQVRRAVLLCPPHPHFAGDMDNNVIRAAGRHLAARGVTLRFDYRGVGDSQITLPAGVSVFDYWSEVEKSFDYQGAIEDAAAAADSLAEACGSELPLAVVGYSFGAAVGLMMALGRPSARAMVGLSAPLCRLGFDFLAACAKPCLMLSGSEDFVYSAQRAGELAAIGGPNVRLDLLPGKDHFFRGEELLPARLADDFITESLAR